MKLRAKLCPRGRRSALAEHHVDRVTRDDVQEQEYERCCAEQGRNEQGEPRGDDRQHALPEKTCTDELPNDVAAGLNAKGKDILVFAKLNELVWRDLEPGAPAWQRWMLHFTRVLWLATEGYFVDSCSLRASALTLASMLALVPALAASFAYVRGLGWTGERLETLLLQRATILSPEAVSTVVTWVDHISITGLGLMGALFAIAAAVSMLFGMEDAFDAVWGGPERRGYIRRGADGVVLLIVTPLLIAVAASSEAALRSSSAVAWIESFGGFEVVIRTVFATGWYLVVCGAFAALYYLLPAAPVDRRAAMVGGVAAGITWQFAQRLYVDFQLGLGGYNAVYGALAQIPALVAWMWVSWVLVLAGAEIAAAWQNLGICGRRYDPDLASAAAREKVAIAIAIELADAAYARRPAPTLAALSALLCMPLRSVAEVFRKLDDAGLVHTGGENQLQCFLSLSPGSVPVDRVIAAVRGEHAETLRQSRPAVGKVLARFAAARREALANETLADLVEPQA
jgi:membrane protein